MGNYCFYILLCFVIPAGCFQFRETPANPLVVYYSNRTNVEFRWDWTLGPDEVLFLVKIKRYRKNLANSETVLATHYPSGSNNLDTTKYSLTVSNSTNGYASFVIKDLTNQGLGVNVMNANETYVYTIVLDEQAQAREFYDKVELNFVIRIPFITTYPQNQTSSGGTVTFQCAAGGETPPTITWTKIGSSETFPKGGTLTLTNFTEDQIGVYICTARSTGITASASGTGFVQFPNCGSGCKMEELGIEFTNLEYNNNVNYGELTLTIQTECLKAYALQNKRIHICQVQNFRSSSLVAVVKLGWPTNYQGDPKQPLLSAIGDGNFAGYPVTTTFVSPTSPAVVSTQGGTTKTPTRLFTRSSRVSVPPEAARTCSLPIGICVTVIVLALLCIAILGYLLWKKSHRLKELEQHRAQLEQPNNDKAVNGQANPGYLTLSEIRQQLGQMYQTLHNASSPA